MSREQIIRDTAYAIWEAEGKPQGRDAQHWKQAEERVAASLTGAGAKANNNASAAKAPTNATRAAPATTKAASSTTKTSTKSVAPAKVAPKKKG